MDTKIDQLKQIIPEKYILRQEPMKKSHNIPYWGTRRYFCGTREYGRNQSGQSFLQKKREFHYLF